jgi:hypothetical protein
VANIQINNGEMQRSRVTQVAVTFDQAVNFSGPPADAFLLTRQSDGLPVSLNALVVGNTITLTFTGGPVEFGSLSDGRYTLTIFANQISNAFGQLDGNGDGIDGDDYVLVGTPANGLFRLFGDSNGDGRVDTTDLTAYRTAIGIASTTFDFNADGVVNSIDFVEFRKRFGLMI